MNERFYAENREKYASEASSLLYNGPFVISEWVHGSHVVLTKNPNYWDRDSVNLERVTLNVLKDVNTAVHLYEVGQIDRVVLSGDLAPKYRQRDDYHAFVEYFTYFLMFNFEKPPFQNAKVRKALAYAVDRKSYVETVLQNGSPAAYGLVPEGEPAWAGADTTFRDWSKKMFGGPLFQDVGGNPSLKEEAKKLLEEGLRESGIPLEKFRFTLLHDDNETARKAAEFLKASWKQNLGVEVELKQVTFKDRLARMRRGDFEVAYTRWGADYNDPETWLGLFETGGAFNWGKYANPAYDHALALARSAGTDYAKRTDAYAEAEKILIRDDMGIAPLDHRAVAYLQKPYVQGLFMRATGASIELKWAKVAR